MAHSIQPPQAQINDEMQPLMASTGQADAVLSSQPAADKDQEDEQAWLEELQARPWAREVLAAAALIQGRIQVVRGIMTLLTLAKWTSLSDLYGRKVLLNLTMVSLGVYQLMTWFASSSYNPVGYHLLYVKGILLGTTAGFTLASPAIFAYVADCTASKTRSVQMGYVLISYALGNIIGPFLGGYIVKRTGDLTSVIQFSLVCCTLLLLYLIVIPESLRPCHNQPLSAEDEQVEPADQEAAGVANVTKNGSFFVHLYGRIKQGALSLVDPLFLFIPGRIPMSSKLPSRYVPAMLLLAMHLTVIADVGVMVLFIPVTNLVFKWTSYEDGLYYSYVGLCSFITFTAVFPFLQFLYRRYNAPKDSRYREDRRDTMERESLLTEFNIEERQSQSATTSGSTTEDAMESLRKDMTFSVGGVLIGSLAYYFVPTFKSVPAIFIDDQNKEVFKVTYTDFSFVFAKDYGQRNFDAKMPATPHFIFERALSSSAERQPLLSNKKRQANPDTREEHCGGDDYRDGHQEPEQQQQHCNGSEATRLAKQQALPWYKRPSVAWIMPFVFLLGIVTGVSQAPQEQLIVRIVCNDYFMNSDVPALYSNSTTLALSPSSVKGTSVFRDHYYDDDDPCKIPAVQALAALVMGRIRSLKFVTGIFTVGFHTSLSDVYGRKALIFMTLIPSMMTQMLIVYMAQPSTNFGIKPLYVDALFLGLFGAGMLLDPAIFAYVGSIVGPILGGYLIKLTGDIATAMIISIVTLCLLTVYAIVLPESLPKDIQTTPPQEYTFVPTAKAQDTSILLRIRKGVLAIVEPLLMFLPGRIDPSADVNILPTRYTLVFLVLTYLLVQMASNGISAILIPYTNLVFHWSALEDAVYYSLSGAASFVVYVGLFPGLQKLYKVYIDKEISQEAAASEAHNLPTYADPSNINQLAGASINNAVGEAVGEALHPEANRTSQLNSDAEAAMKRRKSSWSDLTFFVFGSVVYTIGYLLVMIFETEASFLIATANNHTQLPMTKDSTLNTHSELAGLTRLQLQALCVKAGLDTTADNDELRRILIEHEAQQGQVVSEKMLTVEHLSDVAEETSMETQPGPESITTTNTTTTVAEVRTDVNTEVKSEDTGLDAGANTPAEEVLIKNEAEEGELTSTILESTLVIKSEQQEKVVIKQENVEENVTAKLTRSTVETVTLKQETEDAEMPLADVKVEETSIPMAQRKQFWEARTTNPTSSSSSVSVRSALPVSKSRLASHHSNTTSQTSASQKRGRTTEDVDGGGDATVKDEHDAESDSRTRGSNSPSGSSLPTPGTVRSLIGKFAGSTNVSPPTSGSPATKKRKVDAVKTTPVPVASTAIPRYRRVIKIPVPGKGPHPNRSGSTGTTTTRSTASSTRRKVVSESASPTPTPAPTTSTSKKTMAVSAETINRLATPKKVNTLSAATAGTTPVAPPSFTSSTSTTPTPTRPRGPVLSTASRAAQRRNRDKK
ncbi:hypothetical protein EDD11_006117 [Mortierella claussenii]|nr:hypothetical protein EDD11_006117 [Mortierella claussenii]